MTTGWRRNKEKKDKRKRFLLAKLPIRTMEVVKLNYKLRVAREATSSPPVTTENLVLDTDYLMGVIQFKVSNFKWNKQQKFWGGNKEQIVLNGAAGRLCFLLQKQSDDTMECERTQVRSKQDQQSRPRPAALCFTSSFNRRRCIWSSGVDKEVRGFNSWPTREKNYKNKWIIPNKQEDRRWLRSWIQVQFYP